MKLTQYQVAALAEEFLKNTLKPEIDKHNELINKSLLKIKEEWFIASGNMAIFKKAQKILKENTAFDNITVHFTIINGEESSSNVYLSSTLEHIIDNYQFGKVFNKDRKYNALKNSKKTLPDVMTIRNQIVLATIGTSSVEEIMSKLKEKFC